MTTIAEPYVIHYPRIVAVADEAGSHVELIEFFDCVGGAMWSKHHYAQSPVVKNVRCVGQTMRYLVTPGTVDLALEGSRFPPVSPRALSIHLRSLSPTSEWVGAG